MDTLHHHTEVTVERRRPERHAATPWGRRFVLAVVVVFLLAELAVRVVEARLPEPLRWYDEITQLKVAQMDQLAADGGADVVFAGTSQVLQGVDPQVYAASTADGVTAYNAGLVAGVPQMQEEWLLDVVAPRLRPRVVVWGLSSMDLNPTFSDRFLPSWERARAVREGWLAAAERGASRISALVEHRTVLRDPAELAAAFIDTPDRFDRARRTLGDGGQRLVYRRDRSDAERQRVAEGALGDFEVGDEAVDALRRTVAALQARGIRVVLVNMPVSDTYVELHPDERDYPRAVGLVRTLADELGAEFIDLHEQLGDTTFADFTHVDRRGAITISHRLGRSAALTSGR